MVKCSFCGKTQDEVYKIVAGPGVCICDESLHTLMHSSHIQTPGPATILYTSSWVLPQNEHFTIFHLFLL